jgi:hypothetical protein
MYIWAAPDFKTTVKGTMVYEGEEGITVDDCNLCKPVYVETVNMSKFFR